VSFDDFVGVGGMGFAPDVASAAFGRGNGFVILVVVVALGTEDDATSDNESATRIGDDFSADTVEVVDVDGVELEATIRTGDDFNAVVAVVDVDVGAEMALVGFSKHMDENEKFECFRIIIR
jgi:hypothetical protein